jgi:hypothetical protein
LNGINFAKKLRDLNFEIIFTKHAELRIIQRQLNKEKSVSDLKNPIFLKLVEKQESNNFEEKFKL